MADGTTEEIKARLNIVELIGTYVRLEKSGQHWKACCPFHQERSPSFMVNEEKAMWHCFGCGKGGDAFAFVMEMEGLDFREALAMLAEKAGVELPKYRTDQKEEKGNKERLFELLELSAKFYEKQLFGPGKKVILPYLKERGLTEESIARFRLGYAPDGWRYIFEFLQDRGFRVDEIEQAGLILKKEGGSGHYDRFRDRIMFPIFDIFGHVLGYSARVAPGGDESQAKYINTPETTVYHKSRALYGFFHAKQAMKQSGKTVIVEGNMDVIAMHQAGIENTVAVSGTALTPEQLTLMKRYGSEVCLFFDMDGAGQKAARKSAELALEKELQVSVIALPYGKDAAEIGKESGEKLKAAVESAVPALRYFLEQSVQKNGKETPQGKRKIVEEYTTLLTAVANPIERAQAIKELAREIEMDEKLINSMVNKAFLDQTRKNGPVTSERIKDPFEANPVFGKRSEMLREQIIALMFTDTKVRKSALEQVIDAETRAFLEKHPLFFFVVQAGDREPLALIEDAELKSEATRLSFRILESPEVALAEGEEKTATMLDMMGRYSVELRGEINKREKLISLEKALRVARENNDREQEKKLLAEFVSISQNGFTSTQGGPTSI